MKFRVFVCGRCKSAFQAYSFRVKEIGQSNFTDDELRGLGGRGGGGNAAARRTYQARLGANDPSRPRNTDDDAKFKAFVVAVYEDKRYWGEDGGAPAEAAPAHVAAARRPELSQGSGGSGRWEAAPGSPARPAPAVVVAAPAVVAPAPVAPLVRATSAPVVSAPRPVAPPPPEADLLGFGSGAGALPAASSVPAVTAALADLSFLRTPAPTAPVPAPDMFGGFTAAGGVLGQQKPLLPPSASFYAGGGGGGSFSSAASLGMAPSHPSPSAYSPGGMKFGSSGGLSGLGLGPASSGGSSPSPAGLGGVGLPSGFNFVSQEGPMSRVPSERGMGISGLAFSVAMTSGAPAPMPGAARPGVGSAGFGYPPLAPPGGGYPPAGYPGMGQPQHPGYGGMPQPGGFAFPPPSFGGGGGSGLFSSAPSLTSKPTSDPFAGI